MGGWVGGWGAAIQPIHRFGHAPFDETTLINGLVGGLRVISNRFIHSSVDSFVPSERVAAICATWRPREFCGGDSAIPLPRRKKKKKSKEKQKKKLLYFFLFF